MSSFTVNTINELLVLGRYGVIPTYLTTVWRYGDEKIGVSAAEILNSGRTPTKDMVRSIVVLLLVFFPFFFFMAIAPEEWNVPALMPTMAFSAMFFFGSTTLVVFVAWAPARAFRSDYARLLDMTLLTPVELLKLEEKDLRARVHRELFRMADTLKLTEMDEQRNPNNDSMKLVQYERNQFASAFVLARRFGLIDPALGWTPFFQEAE